MEVSHYDALDYAKDVFVAGGYAYVADGYSGLSIVDISDPASPVSAGNYDTPGYAEGVFVSGNYAYVADGGEGLRIVDISDPANPIEVSYYTSYYAGSVFVSGNYAYVADGYGGLRIVDISDPASPVEAGYYETPGFANDVFLAGSYAYVADGDDGLRIVDASDPASPVEVGYYDTPGYAEGVFVSGNYAYVADGEALLIVDVSLATTEVEKDQGSLPDHVVLESYPDPFIHRTVIVYEVPYATRVELAIYNTLGQRIRTLVNQEQAPGRHKVVWDGKDSIGHPVPEGVYIYRLRIAGTTRVHRIIRLR